MKFILGTKIGMSQVFNKDGKVVPITLVQAGPCAVTQLKTKDKDGYKAAQIGFQKLKEKKVKKSQKQKPFRYLREFRIVKEDKSSFPPSSAKADSVIDVSVFQEGDIVKVSGISKGKGFQGVVKRWGFAGRGSSHGVKHEHRTPGSIGCSFPERVIKGKKMPGRAGGQRTTVKNLKIMKVDIENNLIAVRGAVPGRKGTLLEIRG